ncbi:hypothetical protein G114_02634 [Aeromonas diversa CDC 2478-85]|uniref:Uncharacterized protein n=1 Tax=Aeromonas diversa CDC 2478-85 TaxID=1268237 RepID=N9U4U2_9GAMM|nr:hypothetical protein G114_02634 [Aeromonas diversa CDC 2478-85]
MSGHYGAWDKARDNPQPGCGRRRSVELLAYDGDLDAALPHRGRGNQRGALHRVSEGSALEVFRQPTWRSSVELLAYDGDLDAALPHRERGQSARRIASGE